MKTKMREELCRKVLHKLDEDQKVRRVSRKWSS
ncbi:hypothetical protein J2S19_003476 [Metabacillus malikii]|uniref:Fur-regulated basic protein FbpA n=1 Tax=Metabacillus malikii TaxID=1504265 RepID=A0ABT9ZJY7_9BACI|nr:hypothetical protein [Metabacillus malikii]